MHFSSIYSDLKQTAINLGSTQGIYTLKPVQKSYGWAVVTLQPLKIVLCELCMQLSVLREKCHPALRTQPYTPRAFTYSTSTSTLDGFHSLLQQMPPRAPLLIQKSYSIKSNYLMPAEIMKYYVRIIKIFPYSLFYSLNCQISQEQARN